MSNGSNATELKQEVELLEPGKVSPHSKDAEEAVLGSILINPDAFFVVAAFLRAADFFILRNGWIWEAMQRLQSRGEVIEYLTVIEELRSQERLDDVGGPAYITYLLSNTATSIHAEAYGHIVERAAIRRRMLAAANDIAQLAYQEDVDVNEVVDKAEETLFKVTEKQLRKDLSPISYVISEYYDRLEGMYTGEMDGMGVPSGFIDLDNLMGGFRKSNLIILAARPGMGKTSLLLNILMNAARAKARCAFFSLEMNNEELVQRLISTETAINSEKLRLGRIEEHEWNLFVEATPTLSNLPIVLDESEDLTIMDLRAKCRRIYRESGLDMVFVDYLQLMDGFEEGNVNREQEISKISRGLKKLARELNIPVIAAAQLSRAVEQRQSKIPVLSDLRESGTIEQNADVVMFIYRDDQYNEASERPNEADIIVAKHRNGPTGSVPLYFRRELTQFTNLKRTKTNLEGV